MSRDTGNSIMDAYATILNEGTEPKVKVNNTVALDVLKKMVDAGALTDETSRFLGMRNPQGDIAFGPFSSARTNIGNARNGEWPKATTFWSKNFIDMRANAREEKSAFISDGNDMMNHMKKAMKTAIKYANTTTDFDAINAELERGADVNSHNTNIDDDSLNTWRMLDKARNGGDLDGLTKRKW